MLTTTNVSLAYGKRVIFKDVSLKFTPGNCYGVIGANGAGKTTFLKILAGDLEPDHGEVSVGPRERISVLRQDQSAFDGLTVLETVMMGHPRLQAVAAERDALYAKEGMCDKDGMRAAELEHEFGELGGYEAESEASTLLAGLGIPASFGDRRMESLEGGEKVRVLLAQALFNNPDILLLDEPTNNLDLQSITWLEEFLCRFPNTTIIVSHDRHFLNQVCTHMADIDFGKITVYVGNYDFWYEASQLSMRQRQQESAKAAAKAAELKEFIARFSANASKAKQATSRKKELEKLNLEDLPVSSRKYPFIHFKPERPSGDIILEITGLTKAVDGVTLLDDFSLTVGKGDKIAFVGEDGVARTTLFRILAGELAPDAGTYRWGVTITPAFFPKENGSWFAGDRNLVEWLLQFSPPGEGETFARGFLGRMLFSGDEALKRTSVLSGGERVRCMLAKMMLTNPNALVLDEPTNHLDLETITALNNALIAYPEAMLFASHDHTFVSTLANRIIEFTPDGVVDRRMGFDDYLSERERAGEAVAASR